MSAMLKPIGGGRQAPRHFLELMDLDAGALRRMLEVGVKAKRGEISGRPLAGKNHRADFRNSLHADAGFL